MLLVCIWCMSEGRARLGTTDCLVKRVPEGGKMSKLVLLPCCLDWNLA